MSAKNIPYVNFLRGSFAAYDAARKNGTIKDDTLYFVYDDISTKETGALYLGLTKISDGKAEDVEILVDELSIFKTSDGKLSLKDYGQKYYKYVAATETEPAKYELVNGWIDGLELRASLSNGIGWYQPNPTTVDGLSDRLTTVEAKAESNATAINALDSNFDSRVNGLIANEVATLLSIKVVSSTDDIENDIADETINAEKFLYMIPNNDIYDEYVVVNGTKIEKIGSTEVSLAGYATEAYVSNAIKDLADKASMEALGQSLTAEIEALKNKNTSTDEAITNLTTGLNTANGNISGLDTKFTNSINTLNEQIEALLAADATLENRVVAVEEKLQWGSI